MGVYRGAHQEIKAKEEQLATAITEAKQDPAIDSAVIEVLEKILLVEQRAMSILDAPSGSYISDFSTSNETVRPYVDNAAYNDTNGVNLANTMINEAQGLANVDVKLASSANALVRKDVASRYDVASPSRKSEYDAAKSELAALLANGSVRTAPGTYSEIAEAYAKLNNAIFNLDKPVEAKPTADTVTPNDPAKTPVADVTNLTDTEKQAVETAVRDANPELADKIDSVTVGNDGTVTITYTDGSEDTIEASKAVEAKSVVSSKTPVSKQLVLPNTGENNSNIAIVAVNRLH